MLGNRFQAEAAIKEKLGADTIVNHKVAIFFTVVSEVDGKMGKRECCNRYIFFNCGYCGCAPCKADCGAGFRRSHDCRGTDKDADPTTCIACTTCGEELMT